VVADTPWIADGNSVIWQAPGADVWLFYVNRYGETWSDSVIMARFSKDGANTWSDPFIVSSERGAMVRGKPIVLKDGTYLLPIYHETGHDTEFVAPDTMSAFFIIDPKNQTWTETNRIQSRMGNLQPAPAIVEGDYLVAYMRRGGGYDPINDGYIVRSESHDGGKTWTEGKETPFPNPNAAVDLVRLENGHLLLVYNDSMSRRTPLTVAISTDGDKSYPHRRNIMEGDADFAYPYAVQTKDGKIRIIFTSNRRTTVHMATFDESAILGHTTESAAPAGR
jgi:predicted neuraminidase